MPERASISQVVQIGVEVTPGTAVAANRKLNATQISPSIQTAVKMYRPLGGKFATVGAQGKEWTQAGVEGQMVYTDIVYPLSSILNYAAPVQQGVTAAYKWTFTPSQSAEDTAKTYSVEVGSAVRAHEMVYGIFDSWGYALSRDEIKVKGSMIGQRLIDGITLTASPTEIALQPVLPTEVSVYLDATAAGLGTTKLLRVFGYDYEIASKVGPVWAIDAAQTSWAAHVELEPKAQFKLLLAADAVGMGLLTQLRAGTKRFIQVKAVGPVIAAPHTWLFQHSLCGIVTGVSEFKDQDGVYAIEWTFDQVHDATWGKSTEIQVNNTLTTL
ncbi:MAG: hypothetical protein DYG89_15230 [Caldilinea sp. CFX5]|nr:hypothetical protein [Caldilinea sp. CFX5]